MSMNQDLADEAVKLSRALADNGITIIEENGLVFVEEGDPSHPNCAGMLKRLQEIFDVDPEAFHASAMC